MKRKRLQCIDAREIPIVDFLKSNGYMASYENIKEAWYLSPLRSEKIPSFKVSKPLNRWFDHGLGLGGNIVDLVVRLNNRDVKEALQILDGFSHSFSFQQQEDFSSKSESSNKIRILSVRELNHLALKNYLMKRKINPVLVSSYVSEIHYSVNERHYFAIGLKNNSGGWELRNQYFKCASSPKDYSLISTSKNKLTITEGMFDFFTLITLSPDLPQLTDFLILNSISFIEKVIPIIMRYNESELYLDNDFSGKKAVRYIQSQCKNVIDKSAVYKNNKDLNEFVVKGQNRSPGSQLKIG